MFLAVRAGTAVESVAFYHALKTLPFRRSGHRDDVAWRESLNGHLVADLHFRDTAVFGAKFTDITEGPEFFECVFLRFVDAFRQLRPEADLNSLVTVALFRAHVGHRDGSCGKQGRRDAFSVLCKILRHFFFCG